MYSISLKIQENKTRLVKANDTYTPVEDDSECTFKPKIETTKSHWHKEEAKRWEVTAKPQDPS